MEEVELRLRLSLAEGAEDAELEAATQSLREELLDADLPVQQPKEASAPEGARAADAASLSTLLVGLGQETFSFVLQTISNWLSHRRTDDQTEIEIVLGGNSIKLSNASPEERERLIGEFLGRANADDK